MSRARRLMAAASSGLAGAASFTLVLGLALSSNAVYGNPPVPQPVRACTCATDTCKGKTSDCAQAANKCQNCGTDVTCSCGMPSGSTACTCETD